MRGGPYVVCRACYEPAPPRTKPWQAFVCSCYTVDPNSKRGKALARSEKEARRKKKHDQDES